MTSLHDCKLILRLIKSTHIDHKTSNRSTYKHESNTQNPKSLLKSKSSEITYPITFFLFLNILNLILRRSLVH